MEIYCSRPSCGQPRNVFADLDPTSLKTIDATQKHCKTCNMPLILDGRYILEKPLARGGFGVTYLARDRRTPAMKQCVVKQLLPQGLDAQQMEIAKQLFEREGAVLEELGNHPQIPTLLAFFELDVDGESFFYLVQEFIDGYTLESLVEEFGPLPESDLLGILRQLLPVLQFIHDRNAIHRDIKPANIMVSRKTQDYFLLDFGAVKQITYNTDLGSRARKSTGIFTMGYAAPEQMRGDTVFPATDIFALGSTCVYLLTGKHPGDLIDSRSNTVNWRPYVSSISNHLASIIDHMLASAPQDRYSSAQEVLRSLPTTATPRISSIHSTRPKSSAQPPKKTKVFLEGLLKSPLKSIVPGGIAIGFEIGIALALINAQIFGKILGFIILLGIVPVLLFLRQKQTLDNKDLFFVNGLSALIIFLLNAIFPFGVGWLALFTLGAGIGAATVFFLMLFRIIYRLL